MTTFLFLGLICSGVVMLLALTGLTDFGEIRGIEGFKRVWGAFRKSGSGKVWSIAYVFFLLFYVLLTVKKYQLIDF
jgi:hypothetical protein